MLPEEHDNPNEWSRAVWNANAAFWDARMGEGNDFFNLLVWPAVERLLEMQPGERVLDVACGNGLTSRKLAALGMQVTACDFAENLIELARKRTDPALPVTYHHADAADEAALLALGGEQPFDALLCNMALMDMAEIGPLHRAAARLLRPGGRFVYSTLHPCFNSSHFLKYAEEEDGPAGLITRYGVKIWTYMTPEIIVGNAMRNQPLPQPYFHRTLAQMLDEAFSAGLVLDGLEERAFPADSTSGNYPLSWGANLSEIPPVLVVRLRRLA